MAVEDFAYFQVYDYDGFWNTDGNNVLGGAYTGNRVRRVVLYTHVCVFVCWRLLLVLMFGGDSTCTSLVAGGLWAAAPSGVVVVSA